MVLIWIIGSLFALRAETFRLMRPAEGEMLPASAKGVIVAGSVKPKGRKEIWINGNPVSVFHTGSFLAYVTFPSSWPDRFDITLSTAPNAPVLKKRTVRAEIPQIPPNLQPSADFMETAYAGVWPKAIRVVSQTTKIFASTNTADYWFTTTEGTLFETNGILGDLHRLSLARNTTGWIFKNNATQETYLPGTSTLRSIEVFKSSGPLHETVCEITWKENLKMPFVIEEGAAHELRVRLFNTQPSPSLSEPKPLSLAAPLHSIPWSAPREKEIILRLVFAQALRWGYRTHSRKGSLSIYLPRPRSIKNPEDFTGLRLVIDPGHGGKEAGAWAPSGLNEQEVNLRLSLKLADYLKTKGATVFLTRTKTGQTLSLAERVEFARAKEAHLYLAVHCNDLPSWANPFARGPWGHSTHYYHRSSLDFAKKINRHLGKKRLGIAGGNVFWGDLYVLRELTIPAALIESGYLLYPWQEELLAWNDSFAQKYSEAIGEAISAYIKEWGRPE